MFESTRAPNELRDRLERPLRDLRVSVTDRCNFRCSYCMPRDKTDAKSFLPKNDILDFEEITRLARLFVRLGVQKIRITGGEPLLRKQLPRLVSMLKPLGAELALTTNGVLLPHSAKELKAAGLDRITVSLDALDPVVFQRVCDAPGISPGDVLAGILAAEAAGFQSIKINCAVRRGQNDDQIIPIARHFSGTSHVVRFIEFMDVGTRNGWALVEVMSASEIQAQLESLDTLASLPAKYLGEVAQRFRFTKGGGEVGIIASVSRPFCADCSRARLSADGRLYSCLFSAQGLDIRAALRSGSSDDELQDKLSEWWASRSDRYSEQRAASLQETSGSVRHLPVIAPKVEMSFIGG